MSTPSRPHCERPDACRAKGVGHCRFCNGRASMKRLNGDPEIVARSRVAQQAGKRAARLRKSGGDHGVSV